MNTVCHKQLSFANLDSRSVVAEFSAGPMTSDGGSLLLREIDQATGLSSSMSRALCDRREQAKVHHGQEDLLRQRLFAIAMGYEDGNDHQFLRFDPGLKTAVGRLPETGPALASQPTLSRFENRVGNGELRRLADALINAYVAARPAARKSGNIFLVVQFFWNGVERAVRKCSLPRPESQAEPEISHRQDFSSPILGYSNWLQHFPIT